MRELALRLGTFEHTAGRPLCSSRDAGYSCHGQVQEQNRLDAAEFLEDLAIGAEMGVDLDGWLVVVARHPRRGPLWRCPDCDANTRYLYGGARSFAPFACRNCAGLRYPSQTLSRTKRRRLAVVRSRLSLEQRTLRAFALALHAMEQSEMVRRLDRFAANLER